MTITREEFLRTLAIAFDPSVFAVGGTEIRCIGEGRGNDDARGWRIVIEPIADFAIGQFRLARQRVSIYVAGYDDGAMRKFINRFELHFRRGGG